MTQDPRTPLLTLQNEQAPYRGHWHFERSGVDLVEAIHTTDHPERRPECVIERLELPDRGRATLFARHLINHGWAVQQVHEAGESLLVTRSAFTAAHPGR